MEQLTKYDKYLAELEQNIRFYIKDEKTFAEALLFAKKLESFAEMIKDKVRTRGSEMMSDQNLNQFDFGNFRIMRVEPTTIDEFSVSSLFSAVEPIIAMALVKVDNSKLKLWIKKNKIEGEVLGKITLGRKTKDRKGYIKLMEIKQDA